MLMAGATRAGVGGGAHWCSERPSSELVADTGPAPASGEAGSRSREKRLQPGRDAHPRGVPGVTDNGACRKEEADDVMPL